MSHHCSGCDVNWSSHQTDDRRCPMCGGGTVERHEPVSDDADLLYRIVSDEAARRHTYAHFQVDFAEGERDRAA
jgi:hypothetical protein